jgi:hypothetical protein
LTIHTQVKKATKKSTRNETPVVVDNEQTETEKNKKLKNQRQRVQEQQKNVRIQLSQL